MDLISKSDLLRFQEALETSYLDHRMQVSPNSFDNEHLKKMYLINSLLGSSSDDIAQAAYALWISMDENVEKFLDLYEVDFNFDLEKFSASIKLKDDKNE